MEYGLIVWHGTYKLTMMSIYSKGTSNSMIYSGGAASDKNVTHCKLDVCVCLCHPNSEPERDEHA